jgi:hypothetical protein
VQGNFAFENYKNGLDSMEKDPNWCFENAKKSEILQFALEVLRLKD